MCMYLKLITISLLTLPHCQLFDCFSCFDLSQRLNNSGSKYTNQFENVVNKQNKKFHKFPFLCKLYATTTIIVKCACGFLCD